MTVIPFPPTPPTTEQRQTILKDVLRPADTTTMTTPEVAELCEAALPDCTLPEIIDALQAVMTEHFEHAEALRRYAESKFGKTDS